MSKIFKLRRGTTSTMNSSKSNILLSSGEMFLEVPSNGINSGNGDCRIKVGDGENQYSDLDYAIGAPNMTFRDGEIIQQSGVNISSTTTSSSSSISTITTASNNDLSYVTSGYSLSQIIGSIKSAITRTNQGLSKLNSSITTINSNITTINNDISTLNSNLTDLLSIVSVSSSKTVSSLSRDGALLTFTVPSGYTPIFVTTWSRDNAFYTTYNKQYSSLENGYIDLGVFNSYSGSVTGTFGADIICIKDM